MRLNKAALKTRPGLFASGASESEEVEAAFLRSQMSPFALFPAPPKRLKTPGKNALIQAIPVPRGGGSDLSQLDRTTKSKSSDPYVSLDTERSRILSIIIVALLPLRPLHSPVGKATELRVNVALAPFPGGPPSSAHHPACLYPISGLCLLKNI